ncbi:bacterio-opsin activator [Natronolimnobius sp. AArcel1]|uniref:helix-turn-helix domain-containing protein n=1 Tax=Natronolimnobius sp. AArcel1 TaxID=1679093 RepID=UPI0013EE35A8|nr:helix-turn-helix domain-containing protein [Natronolimnobius sp. AArcel1]NGM71258.1 bacterio-opsin activator [Natronolimnobius sp. AArcel1]
MATETDEHSVIAEISIEADDIEFGRVLSGDFELELERIIPMGSGGVIPLIWLNAGDPEAFETKVREYEGTKKIRQLVSVDDQFLYQVEWTPDMNGFLTALKECNVYVLEGEYEDDVWEFRLRFTSRDQLVEFTERLTANLIPVRLDRIYNPGPPVASPPMSEQQRETIERAYRRGYFEVPRKTTLEELAEEEGISDSAYSKRLRNGLASVIEGGLLSEFDSHH